MKTTEIRTQREGIRGLTSEEIKAVAGGPILIEYGFHAGNGNPIPQANVENTPAVFKGLSNTLDDPKLHGAVDPLIFFP